MANNTKFASIVDTLILLVNFRMVDNGRYIADDYAIYCYTNPPICTDGEAVVIPTHPTEIENE